ncbi:hypothetical protein ACEPAH_3651 [Sanghuangporus vaninii]
MGLLLNAISSDSLEVMDEKRTDIARYIEGNHSNETDHNCIPLLWSAIESSSKKVINYLAGFGPQAAYQYSAKTKPTEHAEAPRLFQDLDKQLPKFLGIVGNRHRENAFTAVIPSAPQDEKLPFTKKILSLFLAQKHFAVHVSTSSALASSEILRIISRIEDCFY